MAKMLIHIILILSGLSDSFKVSKMNSCICTKEKNDCSTLQKTEFWIFRKQTLASHVRLLVVISTPETRDSHGLYSQSKPEQ